MAVKLVYETHSTTTDNEAGIATGWLPGELSPIGLANAHELCERRRDDGIDVVYTSDLHRATQTAEIAFGGTGIPTYQDSRLRECNYGDWNGMPRAKLDEERAQRIDVPFPGGQSWRECVVQVADLLRDLAVRHDGQRVALIGHSSTRYALAVLLDGADLYEQVTGPFNWQEGWEYDLPAGWDGGWADQVRVALSAEAFAFARALADVDWSAPTRCEPWDVRELVAHVQLAVGRTGQMMGGAVPDVPPTSAIGYYSTPGVFDRETDQARIQVVRDLAAGVDAASFAAMVDDLIAVTSPAPHDRYVGTRHGQAIRLDDFLATRVAELVLHGLDVADALGREPWLTAAGATAMERLLRSAAPPLDGWDQADFIRKATGRAPLTGSERTEIAARGLRWLTLAPS